jgi:hypothetical protein
MGRGNKHLLVAKVTQSKGKNKPLPGKKLSVGFSMKQVNSQPDNRPDIPLSEFKVAFI